VTYVPSWQHTFIRHNSSKSFWPSSSNSLLAARVVTNTEQTDLSAAPRLFGSPLNNVKEGITCIPAYRVKYSWRLATSTPIDTQNAIAISNPKCWIRGLQGRVLAFVLRVDFCKELGWYLI
jgi:hypothetical protein